MCYAPFHFRQPAIKLKKANLKATYSFALSNFITKKILTLHFLQGYKVIQKNLQKKIYNKKNVISRYKDKVLPLKRGKFCNNVRYKGRIHQKQFVI